MKNDINNAMIVMQEARTGAIFISGEISLSSVKMAIDTGILCAYEAIKNDKSMANKDVFIRIMDSVCHTISLFLFKYKISFGKPYDDFIRTFERIDDPCTRESIALFLTSREGKL